MAIDEAALTKLIKDSGVPFRENGTSFVFDCPRCHKKDKLAMYKDGKAFVCYYCRADGFRGRVEFALTELLGVPLGEIRKKIYGSDVPPTMGYLDIQLEDLWNEDEDSIPEQLITAPPKEIVFPPDFVGMERPEAFVKGARYLVTRGLTPEHVLTYNIKYSPIDHRVIFPVMVDAKVVGWQARYVGPTKVWLEDQQRFRTVPKIVTSNSLIGQGQRYLMFQDRLVGSEHCVLAEGPISAIKAHKCGGNVASMGKAVSAGQLDTIRKTVKKLYIALDPDAGEEIAKLAYDLFDDLEIYLLTPPQNFLDLDSSENENDLGDLTEDVVYDLFKTAKPEPRGKIYISLGGVLAR